VDANTSRQEPRHCFWVSVIHRAKCEMNLLTVHRAHERTDAAEVGCTCVTPDPNRQDLADSAVEQGTLTWREPRNSITREKTQVGSVYRVHRCQPKVGTSWFCQES
jgi:hypothetical protein